MRPIVTFLLWSVTLQLIALALRSEVEGFYKRIPSSSLGLNYAKEVTHYSGDIKFTRNILGKTEFPACQKCALPLKRNTIVLDMGAESPIINNKGADFRIYEVGGMYKTRAYRKKEKYEVWVSNDQYHWTRLGIGTGISEFDLETVDIEVVRYIKLIGKGTKSKNDKSSGPYIDAIERL